MGIYCNYTAYDRDLDEIEALALTDRHERTWHAEATARIYDDQDSALYARIDHDANMESWFDDLQENATTAWVLRTYGFGPHLRIRDKRPSFIRWSWMEWRLFPRLLYARRYGWERDPWLAEAATQPRENMSYCTLLHVQRFLRRGCTQGPLM